MPKGEPGKSEQQKLILFSQLGGWEGGRNTKSISFQSFVLIFETCFHSKASFLGSELRDMGCPGTADLSIQSTEFQLTL